MKNITKEINITLNEESQIYNQYNNSQLSDELSHYIYNQFRGIPLNTNILLNIFLNFDMNDSDRNKLVDEIRENYGIDIKENLLKLKLERYKQIIFIIIGILLLICSNFFTNNHIILPGQVLSIFGWVIIWEFVYSFIFSTLKISIENKRYKKLIMAKIHFNKLEENSSKNNN